MWHNYHTVQSLEEALALLSEYGPRARIVAGATDIMLELERRVRPDVDTLIDITRVPGLDQIRLDDQGMVRLGALTTHNDCAASGIIRRHAWPLAQACWEVGAPQIRNRATVAGNLITASPANDSIPPLVALEAQVRLRSVRGERTVPLGAFYTGVRQTVMAPDEILTEIAFRAMRADERGMFIKLGLRKVQAISVVNAAVILALEAGGAVPIGRSPRVALGAVAPIIVRAAEAESHLEGRRLDDEAIARAAELGARAARPIDDVRGPADYRRQMVAVIVRRALHAIRDDTAHGWLPARPVMLWGDLAGRPARALSAAWRGADDGGGSGPIATRVNGREHLVRGANDKSLLRMLREDLGLIGTKEGCTEGECGACTVFLDGAAVMSCLVPAPRAHESEILTVEGLASAGQPHPVQQAFVAAGAVQCGYCTPGLVMAGAKALEELGQPTRWEAQQAIAGNLCRCTGYFKILDAIEEAGRMGRPTP